MEKECYKIKNQNECEECLWAEVCDYYGEKYIERCKPELLEKKPRIWEEEKFNNKDLPF